MRPYVILEPKTHEGVLYTICCEFVKVYIGEMSGWGHGGGGGGGRLERIKEHHRDIQDGAFTHLGQSQVN